MSYITITDAQSNPFAPLTSELVKQLRDNPIAIAGELSGAPIQQGVWHPWNSTAYGDTNNPIYDFAVDGALATIQTPVFAAGYEYRLVIMDLGPGDILVNVRRQSTGDYQTAQVLAAGGGALIFGGYVEIPFPMISKRTHKVTGGDADVLFNLPSADLVNRVRLTVSAAGTFARGKVYLERRKVEGL